MRFQGTAEWRRLRLSALERDGFLCVLCHRAAKVVDLVTSVRNGGTNALSNLRSLCVSCDNALKENHAGVRRSSGIVRGCDETGRPIDRAHWWNK